MDDSTRRIVRTLVQDELSAVETYLQALEKVEDEPEAYELRRLEVDHEESLGLLRDTAAELGEAPPDSSGAWGAWKRAVEGTARLLGNRPAIRALRDGEEATLRDYEGALREESLPEPLRDLIADRLLPRARGRVPVLDGLLHGRGAGASYHADQGYGPAGAGRAE